ncbi:glycosyltransferase family 2 protein [Brachyspira pilosicoli]|uniref:glycosyltransferase family 2 protein n=1 Tax=Brachyspira pilosicoli TaxID=52584 RepID=UPI0012F4D4D0|nr:glycosyltransferase family 2 protein [Brachyspira pilosicoli]
MKKVSLIIPCYNEEEVLPVLYERLNKVSKQLIDYECEFLFINDGSKDRTEEIIEKFYMQDKRVKLYSFSRNFSQQAAISCGLHHSEGDIAITIDADLQDPPEIIPDLIKMYEETKYPIIYCSRTSRKSENFIKKITSKMFFKVINLFFDIKYKIENNSEFRLLDKKVIEAYKQFPENQKYIKGLINWMGFEQSIFKYEQQERAAGETKYSYIKLIKLALRAILSFSIKPLRISLLFGLIAILVAVIFSLKIFYFYFFKPDTIVAGYSSTIITILFMGGVQLISLSVISEYLANMFNEVKKRPEYILKTVLTEQNRTEQNRTEQNRTEQNRTEQNRIR